jgi:hypothetical protein
MKSGPVSFPRSCSNSPIPASSNCMVPASVPKISNVDAERLQIAANAKMASGIVRAAAYIANINDASVGTEPAGTTNCGWKIAAMEKPLATRTLIAVTSEASCIAVTVVIDLSF